MGSCRALDWPAKRTTSGFVSGTVFWAAFFMPAVARSQVYAALWAEFWSHGNSTFWEPQCRPQSFRSLVGLLCAPILVTRFASRVRVPVSESLCGPQNWTDAHSGHSIMKLAWCPESGPADGAENLNKKLLNGQCWLCPAPPK